MLSFLYIMYNIINFSNEIISLSQIHPNDAIPLTYPQVFVYKSQDGSPPLLILPVLQYPLIY